MRKLRNKLLLSILTVALTFIALGTTTFAWFTVGSDVTAEAFTATVAVAKGIEIAEKPTEEDGTPVWGTAIQLGANVTMDAVTSLDGKEFKDINNKSATGLYFTKTILIRTTDLNAKISLKNLILVDFVAEDNYTHTGKDFGIDGTMFVNGGSYIFDAYNALRVSFVTENKPQEGQDPVLTAKVFEVQGDENRGEVGDGIMESYIATNGDLNPTAPKPSITTVTVGQDGEPTTPTVVIDFSTLNYDENINGSTTYYEAEFTVNVWIEGWDADCINAIMGQIKTIGFELTASFN